MLWKYDVENGGDWKSCDRDRNDDCYKKWKNSGCVDLVGKGDAPWCPKPRDGKCYCAIKMNEFEKVVQYVTGTSPITYRERSSISSANYYFLVGAGGWGWTGQE